MVTFEFRPIGKSGVGKNDFDFCWPLYRETMEPLETEIGAWNEAAERRAIATALAEEGASILIVKEAESGWLYVTETRYVIHLGHFYLLPELRNRGLGASFMQWMIDRARRKGKGFTLEVLKNSPARFLYERFDFRVTGTSPHTLTMKLHGGE